MNNYIKFAFVFSLLLLAHWLYGFELFERGREAYFAWTVSGIVAYLYSFTEGFPIKLTLDFSASSKEETKK